MTTVSDKQQQWFLTKHKAETNFLQKCLDNKPQKSLEQIIVEKML